MSRRPLTVAALFAAIALAGGCKTQTTEELGGKRSQTLSARDNGYFRDVAQTDLFEIQAADKAMQVTQNDAVKRYAQHMRTAHETANSTVNAVATTKGVELPTMLDEKHQDMLKSLDGKTGADFDKAYVKQQVDVHQMSVNTNQDEADNGDDAEVKQLANTMLTNLRAHLQEAKQLEDSMMKP